MRALKDGQVIRDTYEVERVLGEGAFAVVYRVNHKFLGRQAMKVFKTPGMNVKEIEDLLSEAVLLSRIGHPNIVRVFDANVIETDKGTFGFFTMEYVPGGSLDQFWQSHGRQYIPINTTIDIITQMCSGLAVAHSEKPPIIHRDIKPQNILIGYDAGGLRTKLSDFGLAKRVNPLTLLASAKGTRAFKSPEALENFQGDSPAGDIWATGATMYLMLTDRLPYTAISEKGEVELLQFDLSLVPPSKFNILVDERLDEIVGIALSIDKDRRYSSAQEMLADLIKWHPVDRKSHKLVSARATSDETKSALGTHTPADEERARSMVTKALELAKQSSRLVEAADLLERAINTLPQLREEYEYQLKLWRRGLTM
jgi:serine/threonine protein kinase